MGMLIKIVGQRSFQVSREDVISDCRSTKDSQSKKLGYLDPGYEYEVNEAFGKKMAKQYPKDIEGSGSVRRYVAPVEQKAVEAQPAKVEASVVEEKPVVKAPAVEDKKVEKAAQFDQKKSKKNRR
jgi:hypothetical protein